MVLAAKDSSAKASGGASAMEKVLPKGLTLENGPAGKDESQLLVDGDVDALFHAAEPKAYREGHPKVARLFADSRAAEQAWYRDTGIFPVMHAVAVRADLVESRPALLRALFDAYAKAKQLVYDDIRNRQWYMHSLPWIGQEAEATRALMGDNWWPYGIEPNRKSLEALLTYAHEQGLAKRRVTIEELFPEATLAFED